MATVVNRTVVVFFLCLLQTCCGSVIPSPAESENVDERSSAVYIHSGEDAVNYEHISNGQIAAEIERDVNARCVLCKFFMEKIVDFLEGATVSDEINKVVDNGCRSIFNVSFCDFIATRVTTYVENLIRDDLQPDVSCVAANFCLAEFYIENYQDIIATSQLRSAFGCKICTYFVSRIEDLAKRYANGIELHLLPYCDRLPPPTNKECRDSVQGVIEGLVTRFVSVDAICNKALHACS